MHWPLARNQQGFLINSGMAIDIFEPLKDLQGNKLKSASWYRNAVSLITDKSSPSELFALVNY